MERVIVGELDGFGAGADEAGVDGNGGNDASPERDEIFRAALTSARFCTTAGFATIVIRDE